jgi:hypothetical protein
MSRAPSPAREGSRAITSLRFPPAAIQERANAFPARPGPTRLTEDASTPEDTKGVYKAGDLHRDARGSGRFRATLKKRRRPAVGRRLNDLALD